MFNIHDLQYWAKVLRQFCSPAFDRDSIIKSSAYKRELNLVPLGFTRGVTEHYNPQEPEFTAESFGYSPLESTGQEWYHHGDPDEGYKYVRQ